MWCILSQALEHALTLAVIESLFSCKLEIASAILM